MIDTKKFFSQALRHHQRGQLAEAENIYRAILAANPHDADALHLLGLIAQQTGRSVIAVELIGKAIAIDGTVANYHMNYGVAQQELGHIDDALMSYDAALRLKPDYAEAHYNRGNALYDLGRLDAALVSYAAALAIKPDLALAHHNRGMAQYRLGRFQDALASYDAALRIMPGMAAFHVSRGNALQALDRLEDALQAYDQAVQIAPDHPEALAAQGATLDALGRFSDALQAYDAAVRLKPLSAETYYNRGNALLKLGRFDEALASYDAARRIKPDYAAAALNRGAALERLGRFEDALASYDDALNLQPDCLEACLNRGNVLVWLGRHDQALASYERALLIKPDCPEAHSGRGAVLHDLGGLDEALKAYAEALEIRPDYVDAHSGRTACLHELGRFDEALASCDMALLIDPDHAEAHVNRGMTLLLQGKFEEGWGEYKWRWQTKRADPAARARFEALPLWQGEMADGRTILLWSEQGFGDSIQFVRYVPDVVARGWRVVLEVPRQLLRLLSSLASPKVRLVAIGDPLPPADVHCPLLSLPAVFSTTIAAIPGQRPYLEAEAELRSFWRAFLPRSGFRVGIVWQGSPQHKNDRQRSIPLQTLARLADLPNVRLVSLQKDHGLAQLDALSEARVLTLGDAYQNGGFHDTAALIAELDLVVTVDTSVAHLAGALGRPAWIVLPAVPDWRWLMDRADSPWYPSIRLFRQPKPGNWDHVVTRMAADLADPAR